MTALHEIPGAGPAADLAARIQAMVPVLKTDRLTLRAPRLEDFPVLVAIDESVKDTSQRGTATREDSWYDFMQMTATWFLRGHGWWTVEASGQAVGFVGLGFEPGDREPELGYLFAPDARGKGYATDAASAARECASKTLKLPSLISYIHETNVASQNVARKLGARRDTVAETELGEDGVQVWRHWAMAED